MVDEMMTGRGEGQAAMAKEFDEKRKVEDRQQNIKRI